MAQKGLFSNDDDDDDDYDDDDDDDDGDGRNIYAFFSGLLTKIICAFLTAPMRAT
jgi:hypothetical protein